MLFRSINNKEDKFLQMWSLMEVLFKILMNQNFKKNSGIKITLNADTVINKNKFYIDDKEVIEILLEWILEMCNCNDHKLMIETITAHIKVTMQKELPIDASTTYAIFLLNLGLKNSLFSETKKWLEWIEKFGKYIIEFSKCTITTGKHKITLNENDNFVLLLSILLREYSLVQRSKVKDRIDNVRNTLISLLLNIRSQDDQSDIKTYVSKILGINKTLLDNIMEFKNNNDEQILNLLNSKFNKLIDENDIVKSELKRISDESLEELILNLGKIEEVYLSKKREKKQKNEKSRSKFTKKPIEYIPNNNDDYNLLNKVKVTIWRRKWIKLEKYLRQWQGVWKDHLLFDDLKNTSNLPLKISKHRFQNGLRCLMRLRYRRSDYIKAKLYPKSNLEMFKHISVFNSLATVC